MSVSEKVVIAAVQAHSARAGTWSGQVLKWDKLQPGDTVCVAPGYYYLKGHFTLGYLNRRKISGTKSKPIRFVADTKAKVFKGERAGPVVLYSNTYQTVSLEGASHIHMDGFTIQNWAKKGTGIGVRSSTGNILRNCHIRYINNTDGVGVSVLNADCLIQNCKFERINNLGVYCRDRSRTVPLPAYPSNQACGRHHVGLASDRAADRPCSNRSNVQSGGRRRHP